MISLDQHREILNQAGYEMFDLCRKQLESSGAAFFNHDSELSEEVLHIENRVNAPDHKIDRDCEQLLHYKIL